jgi:hypothetical protein
MCVTLEGDSPKGDICVSRGRETRLYRRYYSDSSTR